VSNPHRILLVDDGPATRQLVKNELRHAGYECVEEVSDGCAGLHQLNTKQFDLLITDWYMPGLNGVELLRRVRGDARLAHLPVIMLSLSFRNELIIAAKDLGVSAHVTKPFAPGSLAATVDQLLKHAHEPGSSHL